MRILKIMVLGFSLTFLGTACKTTETSSQASLPMDRVGKLSLEEWVEACQKELNNPKTGAQSREELQALAQTTDCTRAYPTVKNIVEEYNAR